MLYLIDHTTPISSSINVCHQSSVSSQSVNAWTRWAQLEASVSSQWPLHTGMGQHRSTAVQQLSQVQETNSDAGSVMSQFY